MSTSIKQLRDKYPLIVKYDAMLGSKDYWTNNQLRLAHDANAPEDTVQIDQSTSKITRDKDVRNPDVRQILGLKPLHMVHQHEVGDKFKIVSANHPPSKDDFSYMEKYIGKEGVLTAKEFGPTGWAVYLTDIERDDADVFSKYLRVIDMEIEILK